jgi:hypothetical protein
MRKKDVETHTELIHTIKSIINKKNKNNVRAIPKPTIILAKNVSRQQTTYDKICI